MEKREIYQYDVLVIGSGGAGLRAAIAAKELGVSVGVVCKSLLGKAHTVMAEGGAAAAFGNLDTEDNWKVHFKDTIKGGQYINNWKMVELFSKEAPEAILELERWGALFDRTPDGKLSQRSFGGHTYRRLCHIGDRTGLELIRTLQDRCTALGIDVHMECLITNLIREEGKIIGALGIFRQTGEFVVFKSKAVIIATGGSGKIWDVTSNSEDCTADGYALAYLSGAELINMEFMQFHPTGMVWPPSLKGILVTEAVRGEGGQLKNRLGERFMQKYDPQRMELSTRDLIARAINNEIKEGRGTLHDGVYLDISHKPKDYIIKKLPTMYEQFLELARVDISKEPMEVGPTCHYEMGGINVHPENQGANIPGLFAAGEAAGGLHGANRLGGNSLSDLLVFGRRAGIHAAEYAIKLQSQKEINEGAVIQLEKNLLSFFENTGNENPYILHQELQKTMQANVELIRSERGLQNALGKIRDLKTRYRNIKIDGGRIFNPAWELSITLRFMLNIAEVITLCCIERKESRGAHTREDYRDADKVWGKKNIVVKYESEKVNLVISPIEDIPEELKRLL